MTGLSGYYPDKTFSQVCESLLNHPINKKGHVKLINPSSLHRLEREKIRLAQNIWEKFQNYSSNEFVKFLRTGHPKVIRAKNRIWIIIFQNLYEQTPIPNMKLQIKANNIIDLLDSEESTIRERYVKEGKEVPILNWSMYEKQEFLPGMEVIPKGGGVLSEVFSRMSKFG